MEILPIQQALRPALSNVYGTLDYQQFRETLIKMEEVLSKSGLEHQLVSSALERYVDEEAIDGAKFCDSKQTTFHYKKLKYALRCNIARHLTGESYRLFSIRLADSTLFQWFTGISAFSNKKAVSKSTLERYEKYFDEEQVGINIRQCLANFCKTDKACAVGLHQPISVARTFMDTTCIKANIHFPVDWVLLRDAARSLLLAMKTIRMQGLKHRMIEPRFLLKEMNKLCIKMTHTRRKADSKKQRKTIFRAMKKLMKQIEKHGKRYRKLVAEEWGKTDWTEAQAQQVIGRLDNILEQLPAVVKQAHDRIVGERLVPADKKILSLYDKDAHVIVRGKAGNEVEFGQGLILTEQINGIIIDWELFKDQPPSDSKLLKPVLNRIKKYFGCIDSTCGDRGFASKENDVFLEEENIYNAICPKSPKKLQEKVSDPVFLSLQTRRSQTEARIGIFKNVFLGKPLCSRITKNKRHTINWCILTHNLWVLARMAIADEQSQLKKAA